MNHDHESIVKEHPYTLLSGGLRCAPATPSTSHATEGAHQGSSPQSARLSFRTSSSGNSSSSSSQLCVAALPLPLAAAASGAACWVQGLAQQQTCLEWAGSWHSPPYLQEQQEGQQQGQQREHRQQRLEAGHHQQRHRQGRRWWRHQPRPAHLPPLPTWPCCLRARGCLRAGCRCSWASSAACRTCTRCPSSGTCASRPR